VVPGDAPRATFQRFEVIDRLGSGATGAVYRAWDPQLQREAAIKVIARPAAEARGTLPVHETVDLRRSAPDDARHRRDAHRG
jgi:serine/threonine protein kinase